MPVILFIFLLSINVCSAQTSLAGTIRDESGAAISGAVVQLESLSGAVRAAVQTSAAGSFRFNNLPAGRLMLVAEAEGFERHVAEVEPGADLAITLSLHSLAQQVTVTASGSLEDLDDSARAAFVLGRAELDHRIAYSLVDPLREVAGVRVTELGGPGASTNLRIRGLRPQDTAVLIDGMRLRDPAGTQGDASGFLSDLMPLDLDRLEILRGSGSALYGSNALGGVVNLVSHPGGGPLRGDWLAEGGGLGFLRSQLRLSGGGQRLPFSVGLGHLNVLSGVDGDDRFRDSSAQGALRYHVRPAFALSARISAANSFGGINYSPSLTAAAPRTGIVNAIPAPEPEATVTPAANDPDSRRSLWLTSALFAADHQLAPNLDYRVAYQLVDSRRSFPNGPGGPGFQPLLHEVSNFNGRADTLQGRLNWHGSRNTLSAGGEWERESFDNSGMTRGLPPVPDDTFRARASQRSYAAFAEDRLRFLGSRLQITLSGRVQHFALSPIQLPPGAPAITPPNALTGDAAIMYRLDHTNTKLRAHVGNAFRAPSLYERFGGGYYGGDFFLYGDPRLAPERSVGGDAGVDQYFGHRRVRLSATYFYTQLRSVIGFDFTGLINRTSDPFGRDSGYFSTSGGLARGAEVESELALWKGFHLSAAYTHTRTLERRAIAAGTLRTPRIFVHTASFAASQTWRNLSVTANFLASPDYLGVISGRAVLWPGPRRVDATASYRLHLGERVHPELFARIENVLNEEYFEDGYLTPRRWAVAGFRFRF